MYSYSAIGGGLALIALIALFIYFTVWAMSMIIVTGAAKDKGYPDIAVQLWIIGLFGFVFTPAIIVAALPDKSGRVNGPATAKTIEDELPAL